MNHTSVAVCISDHIRTPAQTVPALRRHVLDALAADVLLFLPRPTADKALLLRLLRPVALEERAHDLARGDFEALLQPHTAQCNSLGLERVCAGQRASPLWRSGF